MREIEQRAFGKIERRFAELRDELLTASQEFAKSESHDWTQAERLFAASKKVDELCKSVLTPISGDDPGRADIPLGDVNGAPISHSINRASRKKSNRDYPKFAVRSDALRAGIAERSTSTRFHTPNSKR